MLRAGRRTVCEPRRRPPYPKVPYGDGVPGRIPRRLTGVRRESPLASGVWRLEARIGGEHPDVGRHDDPLGAEEVLPLVRRQIGRYVIRPCELLNQYVYVVGSRDAECLHPGQRPLGQRCKNAAGTYLDDAGRPEPPEGLQALAPTDRAAELAREKAPPLAGPPVRTGIQVRNDRNLRKEEPRRERAFLSRLAAGDMSGVWKAPATLSGADLPCTGRTCGRRRRRPLLVRFRLSRLVPRRCSWRSTPGRCPRTPTRPVRLRGRGSAAIVPGFSSPASCMASPRSQTSLTPSSKVIAPLAARAEYSPRL